MSSATALTLSHSPLISQSCSAPRTIRLSLCPPHDSLPFYHAWPVPHCSFFRFPFLSQASVSICLIYFLCVSLGSVSRPPTSSTQLPLHRSSRAYGHIKVPPPPSSTALKTSIRHHVLPSGRTLLRLPVRLLQAQHRYVRGIRHPRPPGPREDRPRGIRLREPFGALRPAPVLLEGIFRLGLWHRQPPLLTPALFAFALALAPAPQMKRIVFDNWLLMAVTPSRGL